MSYPGFPPNELAWWLSQQVQQGNIDHYQALSNQFSIPQRPLLSSSRAASYPATSQGQIPTESFSTNATSAYPSAPFTVPYPMGSHPVQFLQAPSLHIGTAAPAFDNLEDIWRSRLQRNASEPVLSDTGPNDFPVGSQQVVPIRTLQQNHTPFPYGNQSAATHLTTVHPTLGLCVLVPIGELRASAPPSHGNWAVANSVGHRHRDHYDDRVDRFRRRHSRELTPYVRYMTPSPSRSPALSPYLMSPSSSVTATPVLLHRRRNTPEFVRSPSRFRGIGGFTPLRSQSVPRPTTEASISTVGTCSQCGATGGRSPYEPWTDGSVAPTPRVVPQEAVVDQGESSRGHVEAQENSAEDHRRFQASMEEVDE